MRNLIILLVLVGLVSVEINAESTKAPKDIFKKLNKRLKHGSFDNIKIELRITTTSEVKDPETGKISSREQIRDINLVCKGKLFKKNEKILIDGSYDLDRNESWNGKFSVSYDEPMQHIKEKKGIGNKTKEVVFLSEKEKTLHLKNYLFNMFHLRGEMGVYLAFTEFYLEDGNILVARSSGNKIREEIHLTDIENALYSKIETYSNDKLIQTFLVEEWTKIDEKYVPKKTALVIDGKKHGPYELNNIEFDPDYTNETFTLKIPYSDKFIIYNGDTHERFILSWIDKKSWEEGDYISAFYDTYYDSIEDILLEPLKGVEDVTAELLSAILKEDENKVATSEIVTDQNVSKNDKNDMVRELDNKAEIATHSKVNPLFYVLGGLLLLIIIGFTFKLILKSKKQ